MKRRTQQGTAARDAPAIRTAYERYGAEQFYSAYGASYRNPHEEVCRTALREALRRWRPDQRRVLDLACGSGEMTLALLEAGCAEIEGIDPYTGEAYRARTGREALPYSFEQIEEGMLEGRSYSLIVCSFALHLVQPSRLPRLAFQLSRVAAALLVLTPHKRPQLLPQWGWSLHDEFVMQRVRARFYVPTYPGATST